MGADSLRGFGVRFVLPQLSDRSFEIVERLESLVHAGEAEIGHVVQVAQRTEDFNADVVGVNFCNTLGPDAFLYLLSEDGQFIVRDGATLTGLPHPSNHLVAREGFAHPGAFHHGETGGFDGREPLSAAGALPAALDARAVVTRTRINNA